MAGTEIHDGPLEGLEAMQINEPGNDSAGAPGLSTLQLSEKESLILELYDRLEELELDISFLEVRESVPNGVVHSSFCISFRSYLTLHRSIRACI
jgi:hypothetical protein